MQCGITTKGGNGSMVEAKEDLVTEVLKPP